MRKSASNFRLVFELEPPRTPDLKKVLLQLEAMGPVVDAILIPDNHLGRPALSSVALAIEVLNQGLTPIVAINARDRNALRLRSDFLTLKAYGVEEVLLLYGDPSDATRSDLKVREMLGDPCGEGLKRGVVAAAGKPLSWRAGADFLFTKLAFGFDVAAWRKANDYPNSIYCGVIVMGNHAIASRVFKNIPDLSEPPGFLASLADNREFGFETALSELDRLRESGADGAHLVIPSGRPRRLPDDSRGVHETIRGRFASLLQDWATGDAGR